MTFHEKVNRAEAAIAVENLHSRHVYHHAMGHHREEYEDLWSKKENIAWAHNYGTWYRERFYNNYVEGQEAESREEYDKVVAAGVDMKDQDYRRAPSYPIHFVTTPLIEVAEDGQSAKGLWYTPGCAFSNIPGFKLGMWMFERYGADFILEDGEWKYKGLRIGMDIGGPIDHGFDVFDPTPHGPPPSEDGEEQGFRDDEADAPGVHKNYSVTQVPQNDPRLPEPYKTAGETFRYIEDTLI